MMRLEKYFATLLLMATCLYPNVAEIEVNRYAKIPQPHTWELRDSVVFIAHRGISCYYPENSLQGVQASAQHSFDGVELDISRSADSLIVFHDEDGRRLLGIDKKISKLTTSELKKYRLIHRGKKSESRIMTVHELLNSKKENLFFYFDMKVNSTRDAAEIADLIRNSGHARSVIVASSRISFIFFLEQKYPEIITCLEGFDAGKEWTYQLMPGKLKPDFYSGYIQHTNAEHITWLKQHKLLSKRIVYGVDSSNLETALKAGFRNIMLDYDSCMHLLKK